MSDKLQAARARARRLKELAHGPDGLFAVFDAVERNYFETLVESDVADQRLREDVHHRICALRDIRKLITVGIAQGVASETLIKRLSKISEAKQL
jgi:hypothetical protein